MAPPAPGATPPVAKTAAPPASAPAAPASVPPAAKPAGPAQAAPPHPKPLGVPVVFAPTRPGEPPFQLKLDPHDRFVFKGDRMFEGSTTIDVKLTNTTNARQTFKVSCHQWNFGVGRWTKIARRSGNTPSLMFVLNTTNDAQKTQRTDYVLSKKTLT